MGTQAEDTVEVLVLTPAFLNKCLPLQKPCSKLKCIVVVKSKDLSVSCRGMSVFEQLGMVSKTRGTNITKVETMVSQETNQVVFYPNSECVLTSTILLGVKPSPIGRFTLNDEGGITHPLFWQLPDCFTHRDSGTGQPLCLPHHGQVLCQECGGDVQCGEALCQCEDNGVSGNKSGSHLS